MPTIHLEEIECYDPRGVRDDVSISASCDGEARSRVWGPEVMRAGNVIDLSTRTTGIEYFDVASVRLTGDYGHDFGSMTFDRHSQSGAGEHFFPGELNGRYRVAFRVDPLPAARTHAQLRLIRLTCVDAQGTHDTVTLRVNGIYVLDRHEMKSGWTVDFHEVPIAFNHACVVSLRETHGQDWSESITVHSDDPAGTEQHDFFPTRSGLVGSAHYRLEYEKLD